MDPSPSAHAVAQNDGGGSDGSTPIATTTSLARLHSERLQDVLPTARSSSWELWVRGFSVRRSREG